MLPFKTRAQAHAIVLIGLQASGKTTFYDRYLAPAGYVHINLDTLRTRSREAAILDECLSAGRSFVVDNTNVGSDVRAGYIEKAHEKGYEVVGIYFQSILRDCISRNATRQQPVPSHAIASTQNRLQLPTFDEGFDSLYFARINGDDYEISNWTKQ